jgi:nitroreductase
MDAIETLLTRRSVRHFTDQPVTEDQIQTLLRAAMHAPSACNQQPWHFIVITSRDQRSAIAEMHPYAKMLKQAPLAIIVCADLSLETCAGNWAIDCAAAMQNLLLAAHAAGLGSVWVGIHPVEKRVQEISAYLGLPAFAVPLCLAAVGYAAEPLPEVDRFKPERIHQGHW